MHVLILVMPQKEIEIARLSYKVSSLSTFIRRAFLCILLPIMCLGRHLWDIYSHRSVIISVIYSLFKLPLFMA